MLLKILFSVSDIVLLFGIFASLMIPLAFVVKAGQRNGQANIFLALFFFFWFISFLLKIADQKELHLSLPHLSRLQYPVGLLRPLFFYFYIFYFLHPHHRFRYLNLLHFIPFMAIVAYLMPYYLLGGSEKMAILSGAPTEKNVRPPDWYPIFSMVYSVVYLFMSSIAVIRFHRLQKIAPISNLKQIYIWLGFFFFGYILFLCLAVIPFFFPGIYIHSNIAFIAVAICMVVGCSRLLVIPDILTEQKKIKYSYSGLTQKDKEGYLKTIKDTIETEKLYLADGLKISVVAAKVNLPENTVSQVINELGGSSFKHFINTYRVNEAIQLLGDPEKQQYTIEAIGYEVGFNSRASFYTAFKKITKVTPSGYKIRLQHK